GREGSRPLSRGRVPFDSLWCRPVPCTRACARCGLQPVEEFVLLPVELLLGDLSGLQLLFEPGQFRTDRGRVVVDALRFPEHLPDGPAAAARRGERQQQDLRDQTHDVTPLRRPPRPPYWPRVRPVGARRSCTGAAGRSAAPPGGACPCAAAPRRTGSSPPSPASRGRRRWRASRRTPDPR